MGEIVNRNARGFVDADEQGSFFPWHPKPVENLEECDSLNENKSLIVLMEAVEACDEIETCLDAVSRETRALAGEEQWNFCVAKENGGMAAQIRKLCNLEKPGVMAEVILLDLEDDGAYAVHKGAVNEEAIKTFITDFKAGTVTKEHLS